MILTSFLRDAVIQTGSDSAKPLVLTGSDLMVVVALSDIKPMKWHLGLEHPRLGST